MAATLKLSLTNAAGGDLNDNVTIDLFPFTGSQPYQVSRHVVRDIQIGGISVSTGPVYRIMISPANYRVVQVQHMLQDGAVSHIELALPVNPDKVTNLDDKLGYDRLGDDARRMLEQAEIPRFNDGAGGFLKAGQLYSALEGWPLLKACFLNIRAKAAATLLPTGEPCLKHFLGLIRMEQDRLFVRTTAALREEVQHSNAFHSVSAALHDPVPGYRVLDSFKTFDRYGNLQFTFQQRGNTGADYIADVDIDDAQGIEHAYQVVRNLVHGPTNPYDIHEILIGVQKLDPGYGFHFAAAPVVS